MLKYASPSRPPTSPSGPEVTQQLLQQDLCPAHSPQQPQQELRPKHPQEQPRSQHPQHDQRDKPHLPHPTTTTTQPEWASECDLQEEECRSETSAFQGVKRTGSEGGAPGGVTDTERTLCPSDQSPGVRANSLQVGNHNTATTSVSCDTSATGASECGGVTSLPFREGNIPPGSSPKDWFPSSNKIELARSHSLNVSGDTNIIYFKGDAKTFKSLVRSAAGPGGSVRGGRAPTIGERLTHKVHPRTPFDTLSINSFVSLTSMTSGRSSSRSWTSHSSSNSASSGSSANSATSSSSSNSNSSTSEPTSATLRVLVRCLGRHLEYKTLTINRNATCRQVVELLLAKCRVRHRDPNLFYLTMEVMVKRWSGVVARSVLVLDDTSRPVELQACHPLGASTFALQTHPGGLVRVCDSILSPGSQYKSVLLSYRTTAAELVAILLNYHSSKEPRTHYALHEVSHMPYQDRPLDPSELPLTVQNGWPKDSKTKFSFVLRRNMTQALSLRRLSLRNNIINNKTEDSSTSTKEHHCSEAKGSPEKNKIISQSSQLPQTSLPAFKSHTLTANSLPFPNTSDSPPFAQTSNFPIQTTTISTQTSTFSTQTSGFHKQTSNFSTKTCAENSVPSSSSSQDQISRPQRPCMTTGVFNMITSDTAVVQPTSCYTSETKTPALNNDQLRSSSCTAVSKSDTTPKETYVDAVIDCTHATPRISPLPSTTSQYHDTTSTCLPSISNKPGQTRGIQTTDSRDVPGIPQTKMLVPTTSHQLPNSCNIKDPPGRCCEMEIKVKHKCAHRCHKCFYI